MQLLYGVHVYATHAVNSLELSGRLCLKCAPHVPLSQLEFLDIVECIDSYPPTPSPTRKLVADDAHTAKRVDSNWENREENAATARFNTTDVRNATRTLSIPIAAKDVPSRNVKMVASPAEHSHAKISVLPPMDCALLTVSQLRAGDFGEATLSLLPTNIKPEHRLCHLGVIVYVVDVSPTTTIRTKAGNITYKRSVVISDDTSSPATLTLWEHQCRWALCPSEADPESHNHTIMMKRGDVVLLGNIIQDMVQSDFKGVRFTGRDVQPYVILQRQPAEEHPLPIKSTNKACNALLSKYALEIERRVAAVWSHCQAVMHSSLLPTQTDIPLSMFFAAPSQRHSEQPASYDSACEGSSHQNVTLTGTVLSVKQCIGRDSVYSNGVHTCRKWQMTLKQHEIQHGITLWQYADARLDEDGATLFKSLIQQADKARICRKMVEITHLFGQFAADGKLIYHTTPRTDITIIPQTTPLKQPLSTSKPISGNKRAREENTIFSGVAVGIFFHTINVTLCKQPAYARTSHCDITHAVDLRTLHCDACHEGACSLYRHANSRVSDGISTTSAATLFALFCTKCNFPMSEHKAGVYQCERCPLVPHGALDLRAKWRFWECSLLLMVNNKQIVPIQLEEAALHTLTAGIEAGMLADRMHTAKASGSSGSPRLLHVFCQLIDAFLSTPPKCRIVARKARRDTCTVFVAETLDILSEE